MNSLYQCVMTRLMAQDQDQEVKDCAISCMAAAVSQLGDALRPHLPQVLQACFFTSWDCVLSVIFLLFLCLSFFCLRWHLTSSEYPSCATLSTGAPQAVCIACFGYGRRLCLLKSLGTLSDLERRLVVKFAHHEKKPVANRHYLYLFFELLSQVDAVTATLDSPWCLCC